LRSNSVSSDTLDLHSYFGRGITIMMGNVWKYARNLINSQLNLLGRNSTTQRRCTRPARLHFEGLEQRRLLAADQIQFDSATSSVLIYGSSVQDIATVAVDAKADVHVQLKTEDGAYTIIFPGASVAAVKFFGGDGDDEFSNFTVLPSEAWGDEGDDVLTGGPGADRLGGGPGADRLVGGIGDDELRGESGNDELIGLAGNDWLVGGDDDDQVFGGDGNDLLKGNDGNDKLAGENGDDGLWGGAGNDELIGALGIDYLVGGEGDDSVRGDAGNDRAYGGDGNDWMSGWIGNDELDGGTGDDQIFGGDGDDQLNGDEGNDELQGDEGDDRLTGGSGNDELEAGFGNDYLAGDDGVDHLGGDYGDDVLHGGEGDDWISGWSGNDELHGGIGNDFLGGGEGDDVVFGDEGNDDLNGQVGNDSLIGGSGDDALKGGFGDDFLIGDAGKDNLSGDDGDDSLYGGDGDDWISGWTGDDEVYGGSGDDYLGGGVGNDSIQGGDGDDELTGGSGGDWLWGLGGADLIYGELGDDFLIGGFGDDSLIGDIGNDLLDGGDGSDKLLAGDHQDALIGGLGQDELSGGAGEDILIGGTTSYQNQVQKYWALMSAWSSTSPYATRIDIMESELFAARLQSEESVFDDAVVDILLGGNGQDWFVLTGQMPAYRPEEVVVAHDGSHHHADHHHNAPAIVHELPALEGFDFIDSLDKLNDRQSSEAIHSLVPHAENLVLQREHLSLFELVRYDQATHIAVRSGAWSDPATWQNGVVPTDGARILIPVGVEIRVDRMFATRVATVRVDGTLSFDATRNTELRADTVVVASSGTFQMGTEEQPIDSSVQAILTFTDDGAIDRQWDPFGISRGLVSHGKVSVYGAETNSRAAIAGPLPAGAQMLVLKSVPVGWEPGDTVVVASTNGPYENEMRSIAAITGNVLVLDQPLDYSHSAPAANLDVHIANTTRNAIFRSESFASDRRGHVMFMHNRDVHVANAGFYRLGRTDKSEVINDPVVGTDWVLKQGTGTNPRARYPVHFHRNGRTRDGNPATVRGSAVVDSPGWGFVNHSSYVEMTDSVAFAVYGSGFTTEVGDEIGGFYGNIAIGTTGSGEATNERETPFQDFGHEGDGFWLQGAGVSVVDNVSAGNQGHAFAYYTRGLIESTGRGTFLAANLADPTIADRQTSIEVGQVPVTDFRGNIGYSSSMGLLIRYHLQNSTHGKTSLFENSKFWNNTVGVGLHYSQNVVLRNLEVIQVPDPTHTNGIDADIIESNITYDNLTVIGYHTGIDMPRWGNNVVRGGTFRNIYNDIYIPTAAWHDRTVLLTGFTSTPKITLGDNVNPIPNNSVELYFVHDEVILDFGPFVHQQAFYWRQQGDVVPFPEARPDVPEEYFGLTNLELQARFGKVLSGQIVPSDTYSDPNIAGALIERR
jgi:Ca2+-binding RTX toxin-like protein